jgi:predicted esterase YcpF (UPF0227 family)
MILYLHGFRSSPRSLKARRLATRLDERGLATRYRCPQLPVSPRAAATMIEALVDEASDEPLAIIGSSLGGYYATWLAETVAAQRDCRVVLLNPATHPERDLRAWLGPQAVYHSDETVDVRPEYLDELVALRVGAVSRPERYLLVAATGDEVLDWREMVARYPAAHRRIVEGSDHGLSDFDRHIDDVIDFAVGIEVTKV